MRLLRQLRCQSWACKDECSLIPSQSARRDWLSATRWTTSSAAPRCTSRCTARSSPPIRMRSTSRRSRSPLAWSGSLSSAALSSASRSFLGPPRAPANWMVSLSSRSGCVPASGVDSSTTQNGSHPSEARRESRSWPTPRPSRSMNQSDSSQRAKPKPGSVRHLACHCTWIAEPRDRRHCAAWHTTRRSSLSDGRASVGGRHGRAWIAGAGRAAWRRGPWGRINCGETD